MASCGATCAAAAHFASCKNESGPNTVPSSCLRKNQRWLEGSCIYYPPGEAETDGDGDGDGVLEPGMARVWPICNFLSFSMWLYFCNSITDTLYIFAIEVSV